MKPTNLNDLAAVLKIADEAGYHRVRTLVLTSETSTRKGEDKPGWSAWLAGSTDEVLGAGRPLTRPVSGSSDPVGHGATPDEAVGDLFTKFDGKHDQRIAAKRREVEKLEEMRRVAPSART